MKAKYTGCVHEGWEHTWLFYEYRGHEYSIIKHNNGYMDKSLRQQHEEEQRKIDERIEHENDPIPEWNDSAMKAFEDFYNYLENGE